MKNLRWCVPLLAALFPSVPLWAKGVTTRVVITASSLPAPIELSDPNLLDDFNVWAGPGVEVDGIEQSQGFIIDWQTGAIAERPAGLPRYQVFFYVKYKNRPLASQPEQLAYIVSYESDSDAGSGYVYLPGRSDEAYTLNTRSIFRGREGQWFRATAAWHQAATKLIGQPR